jgi:AcrR family transcriptional regulator
MGISRPSLYAAFGDKEGLFRKALDRYADGPSFFARETLYESDNISYVPGHRQ